MPVPKLLTSLACASVVIGLAGTLRAQETPTDPAAAAKSADEKPAAKTLPATLYLHGGTELTGRILEPAALAMKTSFGETTIPWSGVAGVKMAQEDKATTTVVLHNGDSISGATETVQVTMQTEWGTATVNAPSISAILFSQSVRWVAEEGLSGTRWSLVPKELASQATTLGPATTIVPFQP